jgi:hypothetical protein
MSIFTPLFPKTIPKKMGDHMGIVLTHSAPYGVVTSHRFRVAVLEERKTQIPPEASSWSAMKATGKLVPDVGATDKAKGVIFLYLNWVYNRDEPSSKSGFS